MPGIRIRRKGMPNSYLDNLAGLSCFRLRKIVAHPVIPEPIIFHGSMLPAGQMPCSARQRARRRRLSCSRFHWGECYATPPAKLSLVRLAVPATRRSSRVCIWNRGCCWSHHAESNGRGTLYPGYSRGQGRKRTETYSPSFPFTEAQTHCEIGGGGEGRMVVAPLPLPYISYEERRRYKLSLPT